MSQVNTGAQVAAAGAAYAAALSISPTKSEVAFIAAVLASNTQALVEANDIFNASNNPSTKTFGIVAADSLSVIGDYVLIVAALANGGEITKPIGIELDNLGAGLTLAGVICNHASDIQTLTTTALNNLISNVDNSLNIISIQIST